MSLSSCCGAEVEEHYCSKCFKDVPKTEDKDKRINELEDNVERLLNAHACDHSMCTKEITRLEAQVAEWKSKCDDFQSEWFKKYGENVEAQVALGKELMVALEKMVTLVESEYCSHSEPHGAHSKCYAEDGYKALTKAQEIWRK